MRINWRHIFEGWRNHLIPEETMKLYIEQTSDERMNVCNKCTSNSKVAGKRGIERCLECGCPLIALTKCLSCKCEINKWEAVITVEEQDEIESRK